MKLFLCSLAGLALLTDPLPASGLGSLPDKPWLGVWAATEESDFDFAIRTDGRSEVFLKKNRKRISAFMAVQVRYLLEEKIGSKWVRRTLSEESLASKQEPTLEAEKVTFTAAFTGDTRVEVTHQFDGSEVFISIRIIEKTTKNPVRAGVEVVVPDTLKHVKPEDIESERDLRKKIGDLEYQIVRADGKKLKLDDRELARQDLKLTDPELMGTHRAKAFAFESSKLGGNEVTLVTEEEDYGEIELEQTKALYHGLYARWWPKEDHIGQEGCRLQFEVR